MPKVRTTITIDQDLIARYQRSAELNRISLSAEINTWLLQVVQASEFVAELGERSKAKGMSYIADMITALQVAQEQAEEAVTKAHATATAELATRARSRALPPSSNTGGKGPTRTKGKQA
jgi:hypothetical protein